MSKLAVFWIHTNTQVWIYDECLMNDLCNPVTYLWGFIVWLKQQPLAFPALAQLFNTCFVVGEDDWGAKWSRAQRGVKERPCSDQPQTTGLILPVEDSVVPLHSYTRERTLIWRLLYKLHYAVLHRTQSVYSTDPLIRGSKPHALVRREDRSPPRSVKHSDAICLTV